MSRRCRRLKLRNCCKPSRLRPSHPPRRMISSWRRARPCHCLPPLRDNAKRGRTLFETIRKWRQERVLKAAAIPDDLWREAFESLPFLAIYNNDEVARLRDKVVLFL